ncbi:30S ribosomal protein S9 [candidate division KSB3 bacterium]|uniref:Small ribosomal subunit protein uS9 n=1 Tax=candidate division KSB3 bacterium TaxID=2044937 RepID=A0A9D5JYE6_9BACT|nr:30S ribosomal protein S9 [candidate division KSB3 bacterium]MBD3326425.1 30S ribosomal protein S9 [candidate division KSB3 bacterium]
MSEAAAPEEDDASVPEGDEPYLEETDAVLPEYDEDEEEGIVEKVYATGKRKTAVARVWLRRGKGRFTVNKMSIDDYFNRETQRMIVKQPMRLTKSLNDFDVIATVKGSGKAAQADAIKHGISKALVLYNEEEHRSVLKKSGFLTRDSRMKERKKYGQRGARARFQFSKR